MNREEEKLKIERRINEIQLTIEALMEKETEYTEETIAELRDELFELDDKLNNLMSENTNDVSYGQR